MYFRLLRLQFARGWLECTVRVEFVLRWFSFTRSRPSGYAWADEPLLNNETMDTETLVENKYASAEINRKLTPETKIGFLRDMFRIRHFEQTSAKYYSQGKMGGFLHLYTGQESVAVGTISLLGKNDHVITAYRDHGHALAVGMGMNECMAELFGKATGCSKGKGGSMHFFAPDKNYWGGHGIVAGQTPLGLGIAYGLKYKGIKGCCLCYLGDGAVNQGTFHESLNLASLWSIPVIYIIENNQYSMGTSLERSSAIKESLAQRADAYNIAWDVINGEDIYEIRARTQVAVGAGRMRNRGRVFWRSIRIVFRAFGGGRECEEIPDGGGDRVLQGES